MDEVYNYCKNNYECKELFISYMQKYMTSSYSKEELEKEREEEISILQNEIKVLSEFKRYEKKLKFRF